MAYAPLSIRGLTAKDYDGNPIHGQGRGEGLMQWAVRNVGTTRVPLAAVLTASGSTTFTTTTAVLAGITLVAGHVGMYCMTAEETSGKYDGYIGLITAINNTTKTVTVKLWRRMDGTGKQESNTSDGTPTAGKTFWILAAEAINFCYMRPDNTNNTRTIYWGNNDVVADDGSAVLNVGAPISPTDDYLPLPIQNLAYVWVISGGTGNYANLSCIAG